MDVSTEAKRIMVQALGKLYSSRSQRGGLRLHRSLLLTLVMKSARDIYHSAHVASENDEKTIISDPQQSSTEEAMDTSSAKVETPASVCAPVASPGEDTPIQGYGNPASAGFRCSQENKENLRSLGPDRQSRKRRGKATVEPDFLPSKRAKLEAGEDNQVIRNAALRSNSVNCNRPVTTLTSLPLSQVIAAF